MNFTEERKRKLTAKRTVESRIKFHKDNLEILEKMLSEIDEELYLLDKYEDRK